MKYLSIILLSIFLTSCNNTSPTKQLTYEVEDSVGVDSNSLKIKEAKKLLFQSDSIVRKSISGEISKKSANKSIEPLMDSYFKLLKEINPSDTAEVVDYRMSLINKLIDFQIQHSN